MGKPTLSIKFISKVFVLSLAIIFMSQVPREAQSSKGSGASVVHGVTGAEIVPGEIIIKLKSEADESISMTADADGTVVTGNTSLDKLHKKFGVRGMKRILGKMGGTSKIKLTSNAKQKFQNLRRIYKIKIKNGKGVLDAVSEYENDPDVEYAEPNYIYHTSSTTPNDPSFNNLWGLHNTGQTGGTPDADIDAPEAWDINTGSSDIIVAVIDSGVDYNHEDLNANMWVNPGEIAGNGIDDDLNGYVDDLYGIDAYNSDSDPMDDMGHGTHVAGTVGAVGNNSVGVVGVNWDVSIMALKFLDSAGFGNTADAITCIEYAVNEGANVLNNSWGGGGYSQALKDAIDAANSAGVLFVAAAGNDYGNDNDVNPFYPASYDSDNIIAVAALDHEDNLAAFSNIGATSVDVAAPGVGIYSCLPGNSYGYKNGTSMATPFVAGLAALYWAEDLGNTDHVEVKERVLASASELPSLSNMTSTGGGVNSYRALATTLRVGSSETYTTIQAAINAAIGGDTVLVTDGTYAENINFNGKAITVRSENGSANTTIQANDSGTSVVTMASGEGTNSVLDGFTITGAGAGSNGGIYLDNTSSVISSCYITGNTGVSNGGGIFIRFGAPTISSCTIYGNTAYYGAGIFVQKSSPNILNSDIYSNDTFYFQEGEDPPVGGNGGGIYLTTFDVDSYPVLESNNIHSNTADFSGGGIFIIGPTGASVNPNIVNCNITRNKTLYSNNGGGIASSGASPVIVNSTIAENIAYETNVGGPPISGGGIDYVCDASSNLSIVNSILWGNSVGALIDSTTSLQVYGSCVPGGGSYSGGGVYAGTGIDLSYSDIHGNWPGPGNIDADPQFVGGGDYHLTQSSPVIDTGISSVAPSTDIDGDPRPQGIGPDMGSDEFPQAIYDRHVGSGQTYATIQAAIDAASNGETVLVHDGTYVENINFNGKAITVESVNGAATTIIDGNASGSVVTFSAGSTGSVLDGFTITGGNAPQGGGVKITDSSPLIENCIIESNTATGTSGGGVYADNSSATFTNCLIVNNSSSGANGNGGGVHCHCASLNFNFCTIADNSSANGVGGAIYGYTSSPVITNSILWGNTDSSGANEISLELSSITVTYSDIQGGYSGAGNIDSDPLFIGGGDYSVQTGSPGIDTANPDNTGAPLDDMTGTTRDKGQYNDMGAFEYAGDNSGPCTDDDADGYYEEASCGTAVDCNDGNSVINPATVWYEDADSDLYSSGNTLTQCTQRADYYLASALTATSGDCNDSNAAINPSIVWYKDGDADLYSNGSTLTQCTQPADYYLASSLTATSGDCDDTNAAINPTTIWYLDDDGDNYSDGTQYPQTRCTRPEVGGSNAASELIVGGYKYAGELIATSGDCDDGDFELNPETDWYKDADADGYSDGNSSLDSCTQPLSGYYIASALTATSGDCDDTPGSGTGVNPGAAENCGNGIDDDCNAGTNDDGTDYYLDDDTDGFGDPAVGQTACAQPQDYVTDNSDCDDSDIIINPNTVWYEDIDGDGYSYGVTQTQCVRPCTQWQGVLDDTRVTSGGSSKIESVVEVDSLGNIHIAWSESEDGSGQGEVYYTKLYSNGTTAVEDTKLSSSARGWNASPSLGVDSSNNIHIVWRDVLDEDIYYTKLNNDGETQVENIAFNDGKDTVGPPSLGVDNSGNIHVVWSDYRDDDHEIYYTKLDNNGVTLVDDSKLTSSSALAYKPRLGMDSSGNVHIVWNDNRDDVDHEIYYIKLDNDGNTVVGETRITSASYHSGSSSVGVDNSGNVHVAWKDFRDGDAELYYTKLDGSDGNTLVDDTRLTFDDAYGGIPSLGVDSSGDVHIVWRNAQGVYYTKLNGDNGSTLLDDTNLTSDSSSSGRPSLVVSSSDNIHLIWRDSRHGSPTEIYYKRIAVNCSKLNTELAATSGDCDDDNSAINPVATETCNGIDDNCSGVIDDGLSPNTYYMDADSDTYGDSGTSINACQQPSGYVLDNTDCDDSRTDINPGGTEVCDGYDNDCANGVDDGVTTTFYRDNDSDGFGDSGTTTQACSAPNGYVSDNTDCNDSSSVLHPNTVWYKDADSDRYSNGETLTQCTYPASYNLAVNLTALSGDCNDTPGSGSGINPGATEVCDNGIDENCNPADDVCRLGISGVSVVPSGQVTVGTDVSITTTPENTGGQTYYKVFVKGIQTLGQWFELTDGWSTNPNIVFDSSCFTPGLYSVSVFVSDEVSPYNESATDSRGDRDAHYDRINVIALVENAGAGSMSADDSNCGDIVDVPVAYWAFDEGIDKITLDASGNANDGTITGASWTTGKSGNALSFDGVEDYVDISSVYDDMNAATGSIELWANPASITTNDYDFLFGHYNSGNRLYLFQSYENLKYRLGNSRAADSGYDFVAGEWVHIVLVYDNGTAALYVNGNLAHSSPYSGLSRLSPNFAIGDSEPGYKYKFNGLIDEVVTYNKALTATEVLDRFNAGGSTDTTPPTFSGLESAVDAQTDGAVELSWNTASDPSTPITYSIYYATTSGGHNFSAPDATTQNTSYEVTGLTNNQTYYFVVRAEDLVGNKENNLTVKSATPTVGAIHSGAVAYWTFDEGSGNTAFDETANANDGTVTGASRTAGKSGNALSFDGVEDYVDISSVYDDMTAATGSIELWANPASITTSDYDFLFGHYNSGNRLYIFQSYENLQYRLGNSPAADSGYDFVAGEWVHIVLVYNNGTAALYVNGSLVHSSPYSGLSRLSPNFAIGDSEPGYRFKFNGLIDEVVIYNKALTATEVLNRYNSY